MLNSTKPAKRYTLIIVNGDADLNCMQATKGLEAVLAREKFFFDNYFDFSVPIPGKRVTVHSIHADGNVTFTNHTFKGAFKGAGVVGKYLHCVLIFLIICCQFQILFS